MFSFFHTSMFFHPSIFLFEAKHILMFSCFTLMYQSWKFDNFHAPWKGMETWKHENMFFYLECQCESTSQLLTKTLRSKVYWLVKNTKIWIPVSHSEQECRTKSELVIQNRNEEQNQSFIIISCTAN